MIKVVPPDDNEELMNQSNAKCGFVHTASGGSSILEALRKKYRNKKKSTRTIRKIEENINLNFQNLNHPEEYYASEFKKLKCTNETIETKIDDIFNLLKQNTA